MREGSVVPDVTVMREAVSHKSEFALLDVLLDRVEFLVLRNLELGVGPSRYFNNHVQDSLFLVGIKGNIVKGRDWRSIFFLKQEVSITDDSILERTMKTRYSRVFGAPIWRRVNPDIGPVKCDATCFTLEFARSIGRIRLGLGEHGRTESNSPDLQNLWSSRV